MADSPVKMEARSATTPEVHRPLQVRETWTGALRQRPTTRVEPGPDEAPPGVDPFRLGFRHRLRTTASGRTSVEQVPLRAEDLLYPQEGDVVADGLPHNTFLQPEADSLRRHLEKRPATHVTSNVVLKLRSDGRNCSPDVAVIEGEFDRSKIKRAVKLQAVGGRLLFAFEVISTSEKEIEDKDTKKNLKRYAREKVAEYFTVYPIVERQVRNLVGRRLDKGRYVEIAPDAQGRVYSRKLDLFFQIEAESKELVVFDGTSGQRLLISDEEEAGRKKAEAGHKKAEAALEVLQAALDAAEVSRKQETEARRQAEERSKQGLRQNVEDLCGLLGIEWTAERSTVVAGMELAQLETLLADLLRQKRWP